MKTVLLSCLLVLSWPLSGVPLSWAADEPSREPPNPLSAFVNQWSSLPPPPAGFTLEFLKTADQEVAEITLREAVLIGVQNNPGIVVERLEPFRAAAQTLAEKSVFDPTAQLELLKEFEIEPRGTSQSAFSTPLLRTRSADGNVSLSKLFRTGTQLDLTFFNNRFISSFPTQALKPEYRPRLAFTLAQPFLRDFGWGLTTIFVRVAENREDITVFDYHARLAQLIQRITEAYWGTVFAKENLAVQRMGVELADELLKGAEARVRAGVLPPVAVTEARAEKARREELVIVAENELEIARATLRLTLNLNPKKTFLPRRIEPAELPTIVAYQASREESREAAIRRRAEVLAAGLRIQNEGLELRRAENQLLPRLDFRAGAGLTGLGGRLNPNQSNPFSGDYSSALDRLGSGDFYEYSVGLVLQFPLGNARARADYARERIELDQAWARYRDLVSQVTLEVERAVGDAEANFKRIQATRLARELAEENLRGQQKRFDVGLVTQRDVIDFQTRFLDTQATALRAVVDYNTSLSRLRLAEGTLLDSYNIRVEGPKREADPWWARF